MVHFDMEAACVYFLSLTLFGSTVLIFMLHFFLSRIHVVRALNVRKGHTFSHLDKSMTFGTDDLHAILFQNFDGSNLRF